MNKKIVLVIGLLSLSSAYGSNGSTELIIVKEQSLATEIEQVWEEKLTESQKLARVRLAIMMKRDEVDEETLTTLMNPQGKDDQCLLAEAVDSFESLELFKLFLEYKACPTEELKITLADKPKFKEAIEKYELRTLLVPALRQLFAGENELKVAKLLLDLVNDEQLTDKQVYEIIDDVVDHKKNEEVAVDDLSLAFEAVQAGETYVKKSKVVKKALREKMESQENMESKELSGSYIQAVGVGAAILISGVFLGLFLANSEGGD